MQKLMNYSNQRDEYVKYEQMSNSLYDRRCIDGTVTGSNKCVGYCRYDGHPGFLTDKHRKVHHCMEKQCFYYVAKNKKEKEAKVTKAVFTDISSEVLSVAQSIMTDNESVRVIRVENIGLNQYRASYITITNEFDQDRYAALIEKRLGIDLAFSKLNYDFENSVAILCGILNHR